MNNLEPQTMEQSEQQVREEERSAPVPPEELRPTGAFGMSTTTPPLLDPQMTVRRDDAVNALQHMLSDPQTSAVMLIGSPGAGKSTLAALLYHRLHVAKGQGQPAPHHMVWLTLNSFTTLPDIIAAILARVGIHEPGLFLLKPEQQISTLLRALRRQQDTLLVVLDQFESVLPPETKQGMAGQGALAAFLEMLKTDIGNSRLLLTCYQSPYDGQKNQSQGTHIRIYQVPYISMPEGVALLQQRGLQAAAEDLALVWQRCAGNVFALVLFNALTSLSGISLRYLFDATDYQAMWSGDVMLNLLAAVCHFLTPIGQTIIHALSLFTIPAPLTGIITTITGNNTAQTQHSTHSSATFERELEKLALLGIIRTDMNAEGVLCYTVHPLMRQYILEHFLEDSQPRTHTSAPLGVNTPAGPVPSSPESLQVALAAGHTQVAGYYRQVIQERCPPRDKRKGPGDVEPIIHAIRHLCLGWRWQRACDLLFEEGLHESMVQWGAWNTLIGLYTAMLPPVGVLLRRDEGLVSSHIAMLYGRLGEYKQSQSYFEQALTAQRQIADTAGEAMTLTNQGEILRMQGEYEQARTNFARALTLEKQRPSTQLRCILLHNLGLIAHYEKDYHQALQFYTEALQLASNLHKQQYAGMILTNLGMLLYEQQEHKEGLALLLASLRLRQESQDPGVPMLERFLVALKQKMGTEAYITACKEALEIQPEVFSRFAPSDMRQ